MSVRGLAFTYKTQGGLGSLFGEKSASYIPSNMVCMDFISSSHLLALRVKKKYLHQFFEAFKTFSFKTISLPT